MRKLLLRAVVPSLVAALLLAGLIALGRSARDTLREQERYILAFTEIECVPPPGEERVAFLNEVQYLGEMPERFALLDDDLAGRLARTFARHPRVDQVERIEIVPPRQVRVRLIYRTPVLLALPQPRQEGRPKVELGAAFPVDRRGILLPLSGPLDGLPVLWNSPRPTGPTGAPWDDATVAAAARTGDFLHPYQEQLSLDELETTDGSLVLSHARDVRILWGHAPGAETADEATAAEKLVRLLAYHREHGGLGQPAPMEHDVRPRAGALSRPLR
jgi:hypothetical protein